MTLDEAIARVKRLQERRVVRADGALAAAAAYEARLSAGDDVLHWSQREMLEGLLEGAKRSAQSMAADAEALAAVLEKAA